MSLPPEIKNMIYEYALISEFEVPLVSKTKNHRSTLQIDVPSHYRPSFAAGIITVNREIHAKTQAILYENNCFNF